MKMLLLFISSVVFCGSCGGPEGNSEVFIDTAAPAMALQKVPPISKRGAKAQSKRVASAEAVMANARQICDIYEEDPHLVVECRAVIEDHQLSFANAIADADAVLTGRARPIYFYQPGGQKFAQADPLNGVRLTR